MGDAKRDSNYIPTLIAVSNVDGITPVVLWADPTTHRLLVDSSGGGANTALSNLAAVAINAALVLGTSDAFALGSATKMWADLFLASGAVINFNNGDVTLTHSSNVLALGGGSLQMTDLTASEILATDASKNLVSLAVATYPSLTELAYVKGVTSAIQTQLNGKQATITDPVTGTGTINELSYWASGTALGTLAVATYPSLTELSYVKGVSSAIQTQLNAKAATLAGTINEIAYFSSSSAIASLAVATYPSLTELAFVKGLTSSAQTQLTARLPLAGGTMTGNITLGENASIALDPAGSADGKYTGITVTGTAGATLAFGDLIYLAVADSRWELADADATATSGTPMLGMCVLAAAADGSATTILLMGIIRADAKFPALTIGAPAYVGETVGAIQVAIPTGADNVIRVVGRAMTSNELYFNPSQDHQVTVA